LQLEHKFFPRVIEEYVLIGIAWNSAKPSFILGRVILINV
jgi:hypothetical protein